VLYRALACDYDGTIATHGVVDQQTLNALDRWRRSGRKLILVTGRELDDLQKVFPQTGSFDLVVAENGALLYRPATGEEVLLAKPPPAEFVAALTARGVGPISVGRVIVATWEPFQDIAQEVISSLNLPLQVVLNKGAVMVIPLGVDKAVGLRAALAELEVSLDQTAGVGDAENDEAMLRACGYSAAVANALQQTKDVADIVTQGSHGAGVAELIDRLIAGDFQPSG
jgi:hydroxymethylpyrimidine pyrophosphatase-like HAD family hydrolase